MADVFLSYKREDRARVGVIAKTLEQEGFSVWWDPEIPLGESYSASIRRELDQATSVVPVWSAQSVDSEWVQEEATLGKRRGAIVPCRIDPVEPPIGFTMVQTADLVGWSGDRAHAEWRKLVGHIAENAKRPAKNAPRAHAVDAPAKRGGGLAIAALAGVAALVALGGAGWYFTRDFSGKASISSSQDASGATQRSATIEVSRGAGIDAGDAAVAAGQPALAQATAKFTGHTGMIGAAATSPNGKFLATAGADKTLRLWDVADGRLISTFDDGAGGAVAFAPKGGLIAVGGKDGVTRVRSLATGSVIQELSQVGAVTAVGFSPDAKLIATGGSDGKWRSWTVETGAMLTEQDAKRGAISAVGFTAGGQVFAAGRTNGYVQVSDATSGAQAKDVNASSGAMRVLAVAPGNVNFTVIGETPIPYLFDAGNFTYQTFDKKADAPATAMAYSADGARIAVATEGPIVQVFDVAARKEIARINVGTASGFVALSAAGDAIIVNDGPNGARRFEVGK